MNNNLKQELAKIEIPIELHEKSKIGVKKAKSEMENKIKRHVRKRLVSAILAAALLIPTSAFAYQSILADGLYGSFENLKKHVASLTMDGYMTFNAKLLQAKGELGEKEYEKFKESLHVITDAKLKYGDKYGNTDFDQVPSKQKAEIKKASMELQPYFDKLNGYASSQEILDSREYELYIEALMTYEKVLAQGKVDTSKGPVEVEKLPKELQGEFQKAKDFIEYVSNKQQTIKEQEHTFHK
ncbi:DUF3600 domain-containing protein [Peribacillus asahii]|uniref:ECF-type sigma factor negative effector n=1 Tax=Peribacillus asahii TaxID=228899 RepID=A0A3Q9RPM0_9BACI|nr:ECF-type sigma factor negative effector [Peribacillus asahii]